MEEKNKDLQLVQIPYFVHEGVVTTWTRIFKCMLILLILTVVLLFASNAMWAYYWYQFDITTEEITMEADDGDANYIGNDGSINYGKNKDQET